MKKARVQMMKDRLKKLINEKLYGKVEPQFKNAVLEFVYDPSEVDCDKRIPEIKYFLDSIGVTAFNHFKPINKISIIATEDLCEKICGLMADLGFQKEKELKQDLEPTGQEKLQLAQTVRESYLDEVSSFLKEQGEETGLIIFDFDGTVRDIIDAPEKGPGEKRPSLRPSEVKVFPGVGERIKEWQNQGWKVVGGSNQKGTLRRREFLPPEEREGSSEMEAAKAAGPTFRETLNQLGVDFPAYFAGDNDVYVLDGSSVRHVASIPNAFKPNPGLGKAIFGEQGKPDLVYMVGDYPPDDAKFASAIGAEFIPANEFLSYPVGGEKEIEN
jgi:histidinol phosphatase-like enzyme